MRFFTTEKLGPKQSLTPEGYLLCEDVPIGRVGELLYVDGEIPLVAAGDGLIRVTRPADEVFRDESMASFAGKSVTIDHPDEDVNPKNWKELTIGVVQNVRRGVGIEDDLLLADLLITDEVGIQEVRKGLREVSCGYDADYEQTEPGRGVQHNIIGNHVALLDKGRCGPRCKIGDSKVSKRKTWKDRLATAFKTKDEAAFAEALDDAELGEEGRSVVINLNGFKPEKTADDGEAGGEGAAAAAAAADDPLGKLTAAVVAMGELIAKIDARLAKVEAGEVGETPYPEASATGDSEPEKDDEKTRTGDAGGLQDEFQDMLARAEILAPGIKLATYDAKATRQKVRDNMCAFRRRALTKALDDDDKSELIKPLLGGRTVDKLPCEAVAPTFIAASEMVKAASGSRTIDARFTQSQVKVKTIAEINAKNREFYKTH